MFKHLFSAAIIGGLLAISAQPAAAFDLNSFGDHPSTVGAAAKSNNNDDSLFQATEEGFTSGDGSRQIKLSANDVGSATFDVQLQPGDQLVARDDNKVDWIDNEGNLVTVINPNPNQSTAADREPYKTISVQDEKLVVEWLEEQGCGKSYAADVTLGLGTELLVCAPLAAFNPAVGLGCAITSAIALPAVNTDRVC